MYCTLNTLNPYLTGFMLQWYGTMQVPKRKATNKTGAAVKGSDQAVAVADVAVAQVQINGCAL